eukprot:SRR837773.27025.p2 GENE.SRR837773.27025~~SRR837773.27025.p2  ORF type:complete len:129 (+),score=24.83 SRR837773.27025:44-388(+)
MVQLWASLNPHCYITFPADNWPWDYTSGRCMVVNVFQWIVTAGVIEETFKFASLLRLRSSAAKVRQSLDRWQRLCPWLPAAWGAAAGGLAAGHRPLRRGRRWRPGDHRELHVHF